MVGQMVTLLDGRKYIWLSEIIIGQFMNEVYCYFLLWWKYLFHNDNKNSSIYLLIQNEFKIEEGKIGSFVRSTIEIYVWHKCMCEAPFICISAAVLLTFKIFFIK